MAAPKVSAALLALRKTTLAQYLDEKKSLAGIADQFETMPTKDKQVLFTQGEPNDSLYLVAEGTVELDIWTDANAKYVEPKDDNQDELKVVPQRLICQNGKKVDPKKALKSLLCRKTVGEFFNVRGFCGNVDARNVIYNATVTVKGSLLVLKKEKFDKFIRVRPDERKLRKQFFHALGGKFDEALRDGVPYLQQIDINKLALLMQQCRPQLVRRNTELYKEGDLGKDRGNSMLYLAEGEVQLKAVDKKDGKEKNVLLVTRGTFLGEVNVTVHLARTATATTTKKSIIWELSQENWRRWTQIAPEVFDALQHELESYAGLNLRALIWNPVVQKNFLAYQEAEMSAENMKFWLAAKEFRLNVDQSAQQAIRAEAQQIFDHYIKPSADHQVNVPGKVVESISKLLKGTDAVSRDMLLAAEEEVIKLMGRDTWPRFRSGRKFKDALKFMHTCDNYKPLPAAPATGK